jgi:hypothetical protein
MSKIYGAEVVCVRLVFILFARVGALLYHDWTKEFFVVMCGL